MSTSDEAAKARAEALFRRQASYDVRRAREVAQNAEAEKIAKLRALRLAKETSDRIAAEVRRARREQRRP